MTDPDADPGDEDDGDEGPNPVMRMLYRTNECVRAQLGLAPDPWMDEPLTPEELAAIESVADADDLVEWM